MVWVGAMTGVGGVGVSMFCANVVVGEPRLASVVGEDGAAAFFFLFLRFPPTGDTLTSEGAAGSLVDVVVAILAFVVGEAGAAAFFFLFLRFPPAGDTLTFEGAARSLVDVLVLPVST